LNLDLYIDRKFYGAFPFPSHLVVNWYCVIFYPDRIPLNSNASFQTQVHTYFGIPDFNFSIHFQGKRMKTGRDFFSAYVDDCLGFWSAEENSSNSTVHWRCEPTNQTEVVSSAPWKVTEWVGLNLSRRSESSNVFSHCLKCDCDCIQPKRLSSVYLCDSSSNVSSQPREELEQSLNSVFWLSENGSKTCCNQTTLIQVSQLCFALKCYYCSFAVKGN
ncbi:hypothetical protein PHET_00774, partial [Paragonimus heterotremus]